MTSSPSSNNSKEPHVVVMDVTPEMAFRWLEGNTQNRPINQAHVDRLVCDVRAGRWRVTHQGIAFDTYGLLIDGQHRLWAIIEANMTVTMRVFFNEPHENRDVLDTGERRSNLDILVITGKVGDVTIASLATLRAMLAGFSSYPARLTPGEEAAQYNRHREALEFAIKHLGTAPTRGIATSQIRAAVARAFYANDHVRLSRFCDVLRSGICADEFDHIVLALRDFLIETHSSGKGEAARRVRYAKTEWALAAFLDGRMPKRLCGSNGELFPLPGEMYDGDETAVVA